MPSQKTVLITGCTPGGIGFAVAEEFLSRGFHVIATARNKAALDEISRCGMTALPLDVTSAVSIEACRKQVGATINQLDILVNNAGRGLVVPATDVNMDDVRAVYETNVFAVMAMVQAFVDLLIPTEGLIVNVASASAVVPYVFGSVYASSKAAIASYSRTLRQELRPFGVRVAVIMAGTVKSNMGNASVIKGSLPGNSLYSRVKHLYEARRGFSQKAGPMPTDAFARDLVNSMLNYEVCPVFRTWFGRPDWLWSGGMSRLLYWGTVVGEWVIDLGAWQKFGLYELQELVTRDRQLERRKLE